MFRGAFLVVVAMVLPLALAQPAEEPPWWASTALDLDADRIDDALDLLGSDPLVVLVGYQGVPTAHERAAVVEAGFELVAAYEHFDVLAVRVLPAEILRLVELPGVVFIEANDIIRPLLKESVPLLGVPQVWKTYGATGSGIVIAVIDDGAYERHPDFDGKVAGSFDAGASRVGPFATPASVPVVPANDEGHATHVAGTIVGPGTESGGTYRGVAPDAEFVDVKVFTGPNQTSSDIVLRGLDWTLSNADALGIRIASMSLGGRPSDGKDALSRAVNVAVDKGMVVVAAAGNAGPGPQTVASPGAAEKAITVGAVDKQKRIAPYSSRGPTLDGRIKPDVVAPGTTITSTIPPVSSTSVRNLFNRQTELYYGALSGTSMAAPHVSGVVALMLELNVHLTPIEVKRILAASAQDIGAPGRDNETGYGFVNAVVATQLARDPSLLGSPQFASLLGTLPEPAREDFLTSARVEFDAAMRTGKLPLYAGASLAILALCIIAFVVARRRR